MVQYIYKYVIILTGYIRSSLHTHTHINKRKFNSNKAYYHRNRRAGMPCGTNWVGLISGFFNVCTATFFVTKIQFFFFVNLFIAGMLKLHCIRILKYSYIFLYMLQFILWFLLKQKMFVQTNTKILASN